MDKEPVKLFDSELRVMDVLWREGDCHAKHIVETVGDTSDAGRTFEDIFAQYKEYGIAYEEKDGSLKVQTVYGQKGRISGVKRVSE